MILELLIHLSTIYSLILVFLKCCKPVYFLFNLAQQQRKLDFLFIKV